MYWKHLMHTIHSLFQQCIFASQRDRHGNNSPFSRIRFMFFHFPRDMNAAISLSIQCNNCTFSIIKVVQDMFAVAPNSDSQEKSRAAPYKMVGHTKTLSSTVQNLMLVALLHVSLFKMQQDYDWVQMDLKVLLHVKFWVFLFRWEYPLLLPGRQWEKNTMHPF